MNSINPLTLLDQILEDYASPKARRLVHALIALVLLVVTAVLAAGGDWKVALIGLAGTLYAAANKANTAPVPENPEFHDADAEPIYGEMPPLFQPGSDAEGFGGDAPATWTGTANPGRSSM